MYVFVNSIFPGKGTGLFLFKEQQKREKSVVSQRDNVKIILRQGFLPFALVACNTMFEAHTHKYWRCGIDVDQLLSLLHFWKS